MPQYRCRLGCILLKTVAILLLTGEIMAGANNFRVRFPTGANPVEKMALIGALSFPSLLFLVFVFLSSFSSLSFSFLFPSSGLAGVLA